MELTEIIKEQYGLSRFPEKTSEDISIFGLYMDCHKRSST